LRFLMMFYVPFLALLSLTMIGLVTIVTCLVVSAPSLLCIVLFPLVSVSILTLIQFGRAALALFQKNTPGHDESELRFTRKKLQGLYDLVDQVARERWLRPPDEIRLAPDTVAHVYEDTEGKEILVIGGFAFAAFSQQALAGIIAHELSHFAAGDTRLGRRSYRRQVFMQVLDYHLASQWSWPLNPLVWMVRGYHWLYFLVWCAHSRNQEILADQQEVKQVGKEKAAAALLYATVLGGMPWLRLADIAESHAKANDRLEGIFAEQVRRATTISSSDWKDACRKELKKKTEWLDSHPQLRDRLAAMGISPRQALHLPAEVSGPPARDLLAGWPDIEKRMTEWIVNICRAHYAAKMEIAQIILGRPVYRP
jgi:Zn-dependent protease with chaperone function